MPELDDHKLLAEFAGNNSETAFATLVARYVNLVYSTALRFTGNPHHAEEIAQAVFIILARKAVKLSSRVVLSGWLYQVARFTAANFLKSEIRRQLREQEAHMQNILNDSETHETWTQIAPLLDEAMGGLGETDRNAVVLCFFENKTAAEVAVKLNLTEAAAHKRVNRALEKLRKFFTKRGVSSTTAIIAGTISANSVQAAPVALAKTVTAVAIAKGAAASGSTLTLIKGALKIMAWTKAKTAIVAGVTVLLAAGTTTITVKEIQARQFYIGKSSFPNGDSIEINSVRRTKEQLVVKGHYNLVSADHALLALYISSTGNSSANTPNDPKEEMQISKGQGNFELSDSHPYPGLPHVTMYSNDKAFAGIYFGNKEESREENKLDLGYYQN